MQALSLIEDGSGGLSARHRTIVEDAITADHPWVAAIYDECKETGDVRGLMVGQRVGGARKRRVHCSFFFSILRRMGQNYAYGSSYRGVNPD